MLHTDDLLEFLNERLYNPYRSEIKVHEQDNNLVIEINDYRVFLGDTMTVKGTIHYYEVDTLKDILNNMGTIMSIYNYGKEILKKNAGRGYESKSGYV